MAHKLGLVTGTCRDTVTLSASLTQAAFRMRVILSGEFMNALASGERISIAPLVPTSGTLEALLEMRVAYNNATTNHIQARLWNGSSHSNFTYVAAANADIFDGRPVCFLAGLNATQYFFQVGQMDEYGVASFLHNNTPASGGHTPGLTGPLEMRFCPTTGDDVGIGLTNRSLAGLGVDIHGIAIELGSTAVPAATAADMFAIPSGADVLHAWYFDEDSGSTVSDHFGSADITGLGSVGTDHLRLGRNPQNDFTADNPDITYSEGGFRNTDHYELASENDDPVNGTFSRRNTLAFLHNVYDDEQVFILDASNAPTEAEETTDSQFTGAMRTDTLGGALTDYFQFEASANAGPTTPGGGIHAQWKADATVGSSSFVDCNFVTDGPVLMRKRGDGLGNCSLEFRRLGGATPDNTWQLAGTGPIRAQLQACGWRVTAKGPSGGIDYTTGEWAGGSAENIMNVWAAPPVVNVDLAATLDCVCGGLISMEVERPLGATLAVEGGQSATLEVERPLGATLDAVCEMPPPAITVDRLLSADLDLVCEQTADIETPVNLGATLAISGGLSASLEAERLLGATLDAVAGQTADVEVERALGATLDAVCAQTASIHVGAAVNLGATLAIEAGLSAGLEVERPLGATLAVAGAQSAAMEVERRLGATLDAVAGGTAAVEVERSLGATLAGVCELDANMGGTTNLAATLAVSLGGPDPALEVERALGATLAGVCELTGSLDNEVNLAATLAISGGMSADLQVEVRLGATMSAELGGDAGLVSVWVLSASPRNKREATRRNVTGDIPTPGER